MINQLLVVGAFGSTDTGCAAAMNFYSDPGNLVPLLSTLKHPYRYAYIRSAQRKNRYNSGILLRKVGILTLSADSGIVPDNSRIAQEMVSFLIHFL